MRPRWRTNLLALAALPLAAVVGAVVVPWNQVYGSWYADGFGIAGIGYFLIGLAAGAGVWLLAWAVTWTGPRRVWAALLVTSLALPVLVINGFTLVAARENTCRIRAANGHDERLHDLPWPLGVTCPYNENVQP